MGQQAVSSQTMYCSAGRLAECTRDEPAGASDAECPEELDAENHVAAGEQVDGSDDQRVKQAGGAGEVLMEIEGKVAVFREMLRRAEGDVGVFLQRMNQ